MFLDSRVPILGAEHLYIEGREIPVRLPKGKTVTKREPEVVRGVMRNDFLVNDDTTGGCIQYYSSVAMDQAGNFVVCWEDYRDYQQQIYAQRYDASGIPQGDEIRVNDDTTYTRFHRAPSIAMNASGNFVISWYDYRYEDFDVFAQIFDAAGNPIGANIMVNDDITRNWQYYPAAAIDSSGNFVISWCDRRNGNYDVYAQRYDAAGVPQDTNFLVNDDAGTSSQNYPSVAMDQVGNFVISWDDDRNGAYVDNDIYAQRYDAAGTPQDTNFRVNDDAAGNKQKYPSVVMDQVGNFVVCWHDDRNGANFDNDIWAQRYDAAGSPQGANLRVNDDPPGNGQLRPSVAMDQVGNFVISWYDDRNGDYDIYAQMCDAAGNPIGANFRVDDDPGYNSQVVNSVAMNASGNFVICWDDQRNGDYDVYAQRYDASGTPQGANFRVNDDVGTSQQWRVEVAMDQAGNSVICWEDERNIDPDIYAQQYDSAGIPQGANFMVNDDALGVGNQDPALGMDNAGNFVICWEDYRDGGANIYAQLYDASGIPQGANFMVNDVSVGSPYATSAEMDPGGNYFLLTWTDYRNYEPDIYAQRYDAAGNPIGPNFRVDDYPGADHYYSEVAIDSSGNSVFCWMDSRNGTMDIYAQRYDAAGIPQGANFLVSDDPGFEDQLFPGVEMDNSGNSVIIWMDSRNGTMDIYAQRYDAAGNPIGPNFRVDDDAGIAQYTSAAMHPSEDKFVIAWTDERSGNPDIYAQEYENGNPVNGNVQISEPDAFPWNTQISVNYGLACNSNTLIFAWYDNRRHKGYDIYGKLLEWGFTAIEEDHGHEVSGLGLRAHPNPFCNFITIHGADNELEIYDVSGRSVGRTENGIWDGKDMNGREVESGVYFLKAKSSGSKALKVIKLR